MADKAQSDTGNSYLFIVNRPLWNSINDILLHFLADFHTEGTFMFSKSANKGTGGYVSVGNTFDTYIYAGRLVARYS